MLLYGGMKFKIQQKDINKVTKGLLNKVLKTKNDKASIIALSGNMGAGKTTLTQDLAKEIGIKEVVVSPTFVIMKIYNVSPSSEYFSSFKKMIHIDAYRLESNEDLENIGWSKISRDKDNLIIIEWPENIKEHLDPKSTYVLLEHVDDETRTFEF